MSSDLQPDRGRLYLGDFHPHLERALADRLADLAPNGDARGGWVVVPNRYLAIHLRRRAAELGVPTLGLEVVAIEDLTRQLAAPALRKAGIRSLGSWQGLFVAEEIGPYLAQPLFAESFYFAAAAHTPGLARALSATLRDLRGARVEPRELAAGARSLERGKRKVAELADLYQRFCEGLRRRGLADARRVSDAAANEVDGRRAALPSWLLLYGFYDLTARQQHLLSRLIAACPTDAFVPWPGGEAAAFARPVRAWLESEGLVVQQSGAEPGRPASALSHLRRFLFADEAAAPSGVDASLTLLSTPDPEREAREVLRGVAGKPEARTAVFLRVRSDADQHYRALTHAGVAELHLPGGEPWRRTASGRVLSTLVELAAGRDERTDLSGDSLPRARVEDLLSSSAVARSLFAAGSHPQRWPQALRRLGVISGVTSWRRLAALAGKSPGSGEDDPLGEGLGAGLGAVFGRELPALAAWVERLLADTAALRKKARSWAKLWERWRRIFERWVEPSAERDGLLAALSTLADLDGVVQPNWRTAREAFEEALATPRRLGGRFGEAASVGDLMALRGVTFDRVVLPGLVERSFPRRARQDPILLDEERRGLNEAFEAAGSAARLTEKVAPTAAEERFLFRLALGSARDEVLLTWPRSGDDGRALVPSTFVLEVATTLCGEEVGFGLLEGREGAVAQEIPLAPPYPPAESRRLLGREFDLERIAHELERGGRGGGLGYLGSIYPHLVSGLIAEEGRGGFENRHRLGEYDGLVDPALGKVWLERRAEEYGAPRLSASALEAYGLCSFNFFHREVLRLQSEDAPERQLGGDPRRVGGLYHRLLHELFAGLESRGLLPLDEERLPAARRLVEPTLATVLAEDPLWIAEGPEALWQARRRRIAGDLEKVLELDVAAGDGARPLALEASFGVGSGAPILQFGERQVALSGRIDRVDRLPGTLRVVDYKTGSLPAKRYRSGDLQRGQRLQLALYCRALGLLELPELGDLPDAAEAVYVGVTRGSDYQRHRWESDDLEAVAPELDGLVAAMLNGIEAGELYQVERGRFCDAACSFSEICGPARRRRLEDKAIDPRVAESWRHDAGDDE